MRLSPSGWLIVLTLRALSPPALLEAQPVTGPEHYRLLGVARAALEQRRYGEAADLYRRLAESFPQDGELWMAYAIAARGANRAAEALAADAKVIELGAGFRPGASIKPTSLGTAVRPIVAYQLARQYAALGQKDTALDWLEKALHWQFTPRAAWRSDSAFLPYHGDPRFRRLAAMRPERTLSREEGWRYDLDVFLEEARRLHASFRREAFAPELEAGVNALKGRIPDLSDARIGVELQRLVVLLRDGHSRVDFHPDGRMLPIDLYWFRDGVFVVNGHGDAKALVGTQVLAFGSRPVDEVLADLPAYVSRDNPMGVKWIGPYLLTALDYLQAMGGTSDPDRARLTVRDRDGATRTVTLQGGPIRPRSKLIAPFADTVRAPLYLRRSATNYWLTALPEASAVYFQFNQVINMPGESIAEFAPRLREAVRDPAVKNLIVDVRHNNGGNSYLYPPLLRVFAFFQEAAPDHRIFYLAGRNTFSAAQNFSTSVERLTNAIFVGEPTGASPNFTGEGAIWSALPYSGTRVNISNWYHQFSFWSDTRLWIAPEVPVELASDDYFAGRDPALEAVLELIRTGGNGHGAP